MLNKSKPKLQELFDALDSGQDLYPLFEKVFPDFHKSELKAINELSVGIAWVRKGSALAKYISYKDVDGFNEDKMKVVVRDLKKVVDSLGDSWDPSMLLVIPNNKKPIVYNWDRATDLKNFNAWQLTRKIQNSSDSSDLKLLQEHFPENESKDSDGRDFNIRIRTAITNPDTGDIWDVGSDITSLVMDSLKNGMSWDDILNEKRSEIEDQNEISSIFPYLRPDVSLIWDVVSPDGNLISGDRLRDSKYSSKRAVSRWYDTKDAKSWAKKSHEEIASAMSVYSFKYIMEEASDFTGQKIEGLNFGSDEYKTILGVKENEDFPTFYKRIKAEYPQIAENLSGVFTHSILYCNFIYSKYDSDTLNKVMQDMGYPPAKQNDGNENSNNLFKNIELTRNWMSNIDWLSDDDFERYIKLESNFVRHLYRHTSINDIPQEDKNDFYQLAVWNGMTDIFDKVNQENASQEISSDLDGSKTPDSVDNFKNIEIKDWSPLIEAFDIEYETKENFNHPFINWIGRLNLPSSITQSTTEWFIHSNQFNEINRVLLRKKDSDESHIHEQLAEKLKNVLEVTNDIMEENKKSGGWWGRVRKGFSNTDPEKWADAFLDFQEHIHKMFVSIDGQIKKDEVWLENAKHLVAKSTEVDDKWSSWLKREAHGISNSHNGVSNPSTATKMSWDKRVEMLTSSKNAHQNIINSVISTKMWLEKVKQSVETKRQLKERAEMFYWSTLSMFSSLQSIQRNTNTIMEQADLVKTMSKSAEGASLRAMYEEEENKEKIREAFIKMSQSESSVKEFYTKLSSFQKETSVIMKKSLESRREIPDTEEIEIGASAMAISSSSVKEKKKQMEVSISSDTSPSRKIR